MIKAIIPDDVIDILHNPVNIRISNLMYDVFSIDHQSTKQGNTNDQVARVLAKYDTIIEALLKQREEYIKNVIPYEKTPVRESLSKHLFYRITKIIGNWTPYPDDW